MSRYTSPIFQKRRFLEARSVEGIGIIGIDEPKVEREGNGLVVTIKVEEGPLFHVGKVDFSGDILIDEARLRRIVKFKQGDVFRASALRDSIFAWEKCSR